MKKKSGKKDLPKKISADEVSDEPFDKRDISDIIETIGKIRQPLIPSIDMAKIINASTLAPGIKISDIIIQKQIAMDSARLMSHIAVPLKFPNSTLSAIASFASAMKSVAKVTEQLNQSIVQMTNLTKTFGSFTIPFSSSYLEIIKTFNESTAYLDEEEFKSFEYNWVGFIPFADMKELYEWYKEGDEEKIRDYFQSLFNSREKIEILIEKISKNQHFLQRSEIIKDALVAHLEGKYSLSIPVLWTQIDGVFIKSHKHVLKGKKGKCENCDFEYPLQPTTQSIVKEILKESKEGGTASPFEDLYLDFIEENYLKNRSKILHGLDSDYPDRDLSTKLILALYQLYECLEWSDIAS